MYIHSAEFRFAIALHHAQKLPSVSLVKGGMVGHKIQGIDSFCFHIIANEAEQSACYPLATFIRFRIDGADVGSQIFAVMKVVFNHTQAADDS